MIVSHEIYMWFVTAMTIAICGGWGARDAYMLVKNLKRGRKAHDEIFGSIIGLIMISLGFVGIFKYHQGW